MIHRGINRCLPCLLTREIASGDLRLCATDSQCEGYECIHLRSVSSCEIEWNERSLQFHDERNTVKESSRDEIRVRWTI